MQIRESFNWSWISILHTWTNREGGGNTSKAFKKAFFLPFNIALGKDQLLKNSKSWKIGEYETFTFSENDLTKNLMFFAIWNMYYDRGSLDRISLDRISWSKVSNNLDVWSKLCFITWSNFTWSNQLIESSNNGILGFLKFSINCQKRTYGFWHLIESLK